MSFMDVDGVGVARKKRHLCGIWCPHFHIYLCVYTTIT